jgi:hypothetical protein
LAGEKVDLIARRLEETDDVHILTLRAIKKKERPRYLHPSLLALRIASERPSAT